MTAESNTSQTPMLAQSETIPVGGWRITITAPEGVQNWCVTDVSVDVEHHSTANGTARVRLDASLGDVYAR